MDKKDFIFPGVILGIVFIAGLGVLLTHSTPPTLIPSNTKATTTPAVATSTTPVAEPSKPVSVVRTPSAYYPYGTVTLSLNQPAQFKDGVAIRPLSITEDSRCPMGVMCIQAGTVKLSLKTSAAGVSKIETIQLGQSITVGDDAITLDSVSPTHPKTGLISPGSYRVTFIVSHGGSSSAPCYVGGCSAQLCTDSPGAISNCMYTSSYACYRTATCERQVSGSCGWTQTPVLKACLANPPQE